jgi:two-component system nitrate/nitrite response regulator NarL
LNHLTDIPKVRRIAVCDTEPIALEGLRVLLESDEELSVIASDTSLVGGMDSARELLPDVLIVDKAFGLHAVMDCLNTLRRAGTTTSVVVWGSSIVEPEALRFIQAGALGVIRKTARLESILQCLRTVSRGNAWMDEGLFDEGDLPVRGAHTPLTARELQVMELVERGMKNKEIGTTLGIRTGTVKIHLKHIFEKTGIRGRYGLALSGLKEKGLLTETPAPVQ